MAGMKQFGWVRRSHKNSQRGVRRVAVGLGKFWPLLMSVNSSGEFLYLCISEERNYRLSLYLIFV